MENKSTVFCIHILPSTCLDYIHLILLHKIIKKYSVSDYIVNETIMNFLNNSWTDVAPFLLDYNYTVKPELKVNVSQRIRSYYFAADDRPKTISPRNGHITVQNWQKLVRVSI